VHLDIEATQNVVGCNTQDSLTYPSVSGSAAAWLPAAAMHYAEEQMLMMQ